MTPQGVDLGARHGPAVPAAADGRGKTAPAATAPTVEKWAERTTLLSKTGRMVYAVAFSTDGKTLASAGHEVLLWDTATGEQVSALRGLKTGANAIALSPDGKSLAAVVFEGGTGPGSIETVVKLCDTATGKVRASVRTGANAAAFAPATGLLSGSETVPTRTTGSSRTMRTSAPARSEGCTTAPYPSATA